MKLLLIQSARIPKYASVELDDAKLILKVGTIELRLALAKTQHGHQWVINKVDCYEPSKDKWHAEYTTNRLWEYFGELAQQVNDLDEKYYDYDYNMQHFLPFISYCASEAARYLALSKLAKLGRMKDELTVVFAHSRSDGSAV